MKMEIKRDKLGRFVKTTIIPNKRKLYNLYWKKEFSLSKLAKVFGVCLEQIRKWMIKYQIPRRPQYFHEDSEETRIKKSNSKMGEKNSFYGKKHIEETIEKMKGPKSKIHIKNMGKAQKKYIKEHPEKIERFKEIMNRPEIREKSRIGNIGKHNGEKNSNWKGGLSFEPYSPEFNKELKEKIRARDNYECQECHKKQEEFKENLSVHHIDYNKKNNNPLNLISLCKKHHMKTNSNRKHWERYFQMQVFIREFFNPENIVVFNENKQLIGLGKI